MSHQGGGPRNYVHKVFHNQVVDDLKARVAELEQKLIVKSERVVLLESELQIPDAKNYKTALEDAFDKCSIAIDGNDRWEYPAQMIRAVEWVVRERDEAKDRVAELETLIEHTTMEVPGYDSEVNTKEQLPKMIMDMRNAMLDVEDHGPEWIVNDNGELGVRMLGRYFFLYKGKNFEYHDGKHDDGGPVMVRPVGKREFGEVCHPRDWWPLCNACSSAQSNFPQVYTVGDGWTPLPDQSGEGES